jgi:hypothetical protein
VDKEGDDDDDDEHVAFESFDELLLLLLLLVFAEFLFSFGDADLKRFDRLKNEPLPNMSPAFGCNAQ